MNAKEIADRIAFLKELTDFAVDTGHRYGECMAFKTGRARAAYVSRKLTDYYGFTFKTDVGAFILGTSVCIWYHPGRPYESAPADIVFNIHWRFNTEEYWLKHLDKSPAWQLAIRELMREPKPARRVTSRKAAGTALIAKALRGAREEEAQRATLAQLTRPDRLQ